MYGNMPIQGLCMGISLYGPMYGNMPIQGLYMGICLYRARNRPIPIQLTHKGGYNRATAATTV